MAICVAVFSYPRFKIVYLSSDFRLGRSGNGAVSVLNPLLNYLQFDGFLCEYLDTRNVQINDAVW